MRCFTHICPVQNCRSNRLELGQRLADDSNIEREVGEKSGKNCESAGGDLIATLALPGMAFRLGEHLLLRSATFVDLFGLCCR